MISYRRHKGASVNHWGSSAGVILVASGSLERLHKWREMAFGIEVNYIRFRACLESATRKFGNTVQPHWSSVTKRSSSGDEAYS